MRGIEMIKYLDEIREIIINELVYLGYDLSLFGTRYLLEGLYIIINKDLIDSINLKSEIYPIIAKKYNTTENNIKCSINYANTIMYWHCSKSKFESDFKVFDNTRPSTKKILYSIISNVEKKIA